MGILLEVTCDNCGESRQYSNKLKAELKKLFEAGWSLQREVLCPLCVARKEDPTFTEVFSDGSVVGGNPGHGGWAWVVTDGAVEGAGTSDHYPTTNQRMEIKAAAEALKSTSSPVRLFTDSRYVTDCLNNEWYVKWIKNGWKTRTGDPVKNQDLWEELVSVYSKHSKVEVVWVKGHADTVLNNAADELARSAARKGQALHKD